MKKMNKVNLLVSYYKFRDIYSLVKELSWQISSFQKRFPLPEAMSDKELQDNIDAYIAMYSKLDEAVKRWNKTFKEYKNEE